MNRAPSPDVVDPCPGTRSLHLFGSFYYSPGRKQPALKIKMLKGAQYFSFFPPLEITIYIIGPYPKKLLVFVKSLIPQE
jgi:hypothetical protein